MFSYTLVANSKSLLASTVHYLRFPMGLGVLAISALPCRARWPYAPHFTCHPVHEWRWKRTM